MQSDFTGTVYAIQNIINGKLYIGQTINNVHDRFCQHRGGLNNDIHYNAYLQNSWNKYGEENFKFVVIEKGLGSIRELNKAEDFWIQYLRSMRNKDGYNLRAGGFNSEFTDEHKNKISKSLTGNTLSKEHKNKISQAHKGRVFAEWEKRKLRERSPKYWKNKSRSTKTKSIISNSVSAYYKNNDAWNKGLRGDDSHASKKVMIISTGEVFNSQTELAEYEGVKPCTVSYQCNRAKNPKYKFI